MEYVPSQAQNHRTLGRVAILATETMAHEANHLLTHTIVIQVPQDGQHPSTLEVAYALSMQLHVPRYNIRVTLTSQMRSSPASS